MDAVLALASPRSPVGLPQPRCPPRDLLPAAAPSGTVAQRGIRRSARWLAPNHVPIAGAPRSRARPVSIGGAPLLVADLKDIVRSKKATGPAQGPRELATLEATLHENRNGSRDPARSPLRKESQRALVDLIRKRLALPPEKRLNVLPEEDRSHGNRTLITAQTREAPCPPPPRYAALRRFRTK